jgi:hypothetical protein
LPFTFEQAGSAAVLAHGKTGMSASIRDETQAEHPSM